jgi:hypothetical protein
MGVGAAVQQGNLLDAAVKDLEIIAGSTAYALPKPPAGVKKIADCPAGAKDGERRAEPDIEPRVAKTRLNGRGERRQHSAAMRGVQLGGQHDVRGDGLGDVGPLHGHPRLHGQGEALARRERPDRLCHAMLEQQTAVPPMSKRSIVGIYVGGSLTPVEASINDAVSFLQADGNGNMNGIQNYSAPAGPGTQNLVSTYQVDASGRALLTPTTGNLGGIMYVVSPKKVVLLPSGSTPALSTFASAQTQ